MLTLTNARWQLLLPKLRAHCPRLTLLDLQECQQRIDLLIAKIQNRHWIDRVAARRTVLALLKDIGGTAGEA